MANSPSKYFQHYDWGPRQRLAEDLVIQAIKQNGINLKYIPRENVERDHLFGDDPYTKFENAVEFEAWVKSVDSFEGQGDILTKIGFMISDQVVFTIARRRWQQIRSEKLINEHGYLFQQEGTNLSVHSESSGYLLEDGNANGYTITFDKPRPGDLIWFPMVGKIFEITHVEHETLFYQFGKLLTYDLRCELFKYSNEQFETGDANIDAIEDRYTIDMGEDEYLNEDGEALLGEDGDNLIQETYRVEDGDRTANNELLQYSANSSLINFGEKSPLVKRNEW